MVDAASNPALVSRLLNLPAELRLQILEEVLTNAGCTGTLLDGAHGGFLPPPLLRTCHAFRRDGLKIITEDTDFNFEIDDYDPTDLIRFDAWQHDVYPYYGISVDCQMVLHSVHLPNDLDRARDCLWIWLEEFYQKDLHFTFLQKDFVLEKMRRHAVLEQDDHMDNHLQYVPTLK